MAQYIQTGRYLGKEYDAGHEAVIGVVFNQDFCL